jgi:DNA-binding transcriptional LysR family regulator
MYRPKQLDLITQYVGDLSLATFAARGYLKRRGTPKRPEDLAHHDIVGMDRATAIVAGFRRAGVPVERDFFKLRTEDAPTYWALVRAGCGIGFGQRAVAAKERGVVEIPLDLGLPKLPVWLTAHEVIRHAPRVQRVWSLLDAGLRALCDPRPSGRPPRTGSGPASPA